MREMAFSDLRAHLAETLSELQGATEPLLISRRGEAAAVLMSLAQYERLLHAEDSSPYAQWLAWRQAAQVDGFFDTGPEGETDPWADVRDRQTWRAVQWPDEIAKPEQQNRLAAEPVATYRSGTPPAPAKRPRKARP